MNESFVYYRSFAEALEQLPAEQFKAVSIALNKYALDGVEPDDIDPISKAFFLLMKPQIDANNRKRESGRRGGEAKCKQNEAKCKQNEANSKQTEANVNANANANVNVNDKEKPSNDGKKKNSFSKPTLEEVQEYCRERRNSVDPQKFVDYYESIGWRVGKNPMKDWKAAVRTWERNKSSPSSPKQEMKDGIKRNEDYDAWMVEQVIGGIEHEQGNIDRQIG